RCHAAAGESGSEPMTTSARGSAITAAQAGAEYVKPIPTSLPTRISASTTVVDSQLRVPSSSGASVGTVKLRARTLWTTVRPARTLGGGAAARAVPVLITLVEADPE